MNPADVTSVMVLTPYRATQGVGNVWALPASASRPAPRAWRGRFAGQAGGGIWTRRGALPGADSIKADSIKADSARADSVRRARAPGGRAVVTVGRRVPDRDRGGSCCWSLHFAVQPLMPLARVARLPRHRPAARAAVRIRPGVAAVLGFALGLVTDSLSLGGFGAGALALTIVGFGASWLKAVFFADNLAINAVFLFLGKWVFDVLYALAEHTMSLGQTLAQILLWSPLSAAVTAVVGVVVLAILRPLDSARRGRDELSPERGAAPARRAAALLFLGGVRRAHRRVLPHADPPQRRNRAAVGREPAARSAAAGAAGHDRAIARARIIAENVLGLLGVAPAATRRFAARARCSALAETIAADAASRWTRPSGGSGAARSGPP